MARHCSDQSIGRSVRRLTQKPRGSRPSIAASAKTEETRRIARARHPRGGVGRGPSRRRSGCGPGGRGRRRVRPRRPRPGRARRRASERQVLLETRVGGDARVDSAANGRSCRHASFAASIFSCLDDTKFHGVASCRPCAKSATLRPAAAKEHDMPEPTTSATDAAPAAVEDEPIRERVKKLTSQVLQQGRVDSEAVREVASAVLGRTPGSTAVTGAKAREFFAEAVRQLDDTLVKSASATHGALQQLASRGQDFTDNDLKEALVSLRKLEEDYVGVSNRLAEALSANLRREMTEITAHAQNLGVEASVRVASMMGEFASSMGAGSGLATVRGASANMAMLASGVLAGIADALRAHTEAKEGK